MCLYLLRYSEIFLKSEAVRRRWENALIFNIRNALPECRVKRERGRIWLDGVSNPDKLKRLFGIISFSKCKYCMLKDLNSFVLDFCDEIAIERARTFAVRVKRVGTHEFTSPQKVAELGSLVLNKFKDFNLKVDLKSPEKTLFVEIRNEDCYLFDDVVKGAGGIPLGVEGKLLALFSGGIDSPVAAWFMMKRGCRVIPIYFDNTPFSDESSLRRAKRVAEILKEYQPDFEIRVEDGGNFLIRAKEVLRKDGIENYTCILCKRQMYRVAERIAKEEGAKGIVTGEAIGQVASQTLDNLLVLDEACSLPVYRPLIGLDKIEIERIAKEIGTFEASIFPASSCSAVPDKPTTKAKLDKVLEAEKEVLSSLSW
ncbi:MAG: tRNA 4-thiouridine(8) synthase ThiI [Methanophagales archaeon]|nr:tRNA 4-thiouridine(8) synthase ThiI [Methanophagales archaeon]